MILWRKADRSKLNRGDECRDFDYESLLVVSEFDISSMRTNKEKQFPSVSMSDYDQLCISICIHIPYPNNLYLETKTPK